MCFQHFLMCYGNDRISSTVIVKIPFDLLLVVPRGLSHSILREKLGHKFSFTGKIALFFKNMCFQQPV